MKLSHGMRISCKIDRKEVKHAVIVKEEEYFFVCQNIIAGARGWRHANNKLGFMFSWAITAFEGIVHDRSVTDIKPLSNDIENVYQGAVIVSTSGRRKVLGICGEVIFVSITDRFNEVFTNQYTILELRNAGYKLKLPDPEPEETMIEIKGKKWTESTIVEALKKHVE